MDYKKICFIAVLFGLVFHAGDDLLYQYKTYLGYGTEWEKGDFGPEFGKTSFRYTDEGYRKDELPMMALLGNELSEGWQVDYNGNVTAYRSPYARPDQEGYERGSYDLTLTRFKRLRYYQWQEWIQRRTKN